MTHAVRRMQSRLVGGALLVALLAVGVTAAGAQDAETPPGAHPIHIHNGTCAELDPAVLQPLSPVGPQTNEDGETPAADQFRGTTESDPVQVSRTEGVEISVDDLLATSHAINIHESEQNIDNYIACADLGGYVIDDRLIVSVKPLNNSGFGGIAILEADGDNANVTVYLASGMTGEGGATTPTPGAATPTL